MADSIDREKLIRDLIDKGFYPALVKRAIENTPTEDVVPRSEVEEIINYFERHLQIKRKQVDVSFTSRDMRNYQCGAIDIIEYFEEWCAELKKKYIGEKK